MAPRSAGDDTPPGDQGPGARHSLRAWAAVAASAVAVVVVAIVALGGGGSPAGNATLPRAATAAAAPPAGTSTETTAALRLIAGVSSKPLVDAGKPVVFFMGGQFCAFCASERWAFVQATSRFGTWTNLRALHSTKGSDGFASIATYDLIGARFHSDLISLRHKEVADLSGNRLQPLDSVETSLVDAYDGGGGVPFIVAGGSAGQYTVQLAYSPGLIEGHSYEDLRHGVLSGADTPAVRAIAGEADAMTALLCKLSGGKPASVCAAAPIAALGSSLSAPAA